MIELALSSSVDSLGYVVALQNSKTVRALVL